MFFGAPSSDYTADSAFEAIAEMISYTNNGKLMIMRVPVEDLDLDDIVLVVFDSDGLPA